MNNVLMIPIHLDALYLKSDRLVVEAMADFSRLPHQDQRDVNPNIANISEEIVSQPFQNQNLYLKAGIHLHWALPDALTKGIQTQDNNQTKTAFPAVPNRWLVTRSRGDKIEQQWVVESDYIYPHKEGSQTGSIAYPCQRNGENQPFCYLGRKIPLENWQDNLDNSEYLPFLTAVGYGEPTFAAFYPNCHSVFGFYDDDYSQEIPKDLEYDIIGWYSQAQQHYWQDFLEKLRNNLQQQGSTTPINTQTLLEAQFKWKITLETEQELPASIPFICYARLKFTPNTNINNPDRQASGKVTVGNTGTEALSAYLAQEINRNNKSIIEEQLEALHLSSRLENHQLDMTPKLKEGRHENGFNAINAGTLWTIRLQNPNSQTADANDAHEQQQVTLPDNIAHLLNELNLYQQQYDFAFQEIESMRRQLFSDWYKYMLCSYPPQGSKDVYPDIDQVKYYIQEKVIAPLNKKIIATGNLTLIWDKAGQLSRAEVNNDSRTSLAYLLVDKINNLLQIIKGINAKNVEEKIPHIWILQQVTAPRYWQPKEPVVLVTGEGAKPSPKHGQDGRLRKDGLLECQLLRDVTIPIEKNSFAPIRQAMDELEKAQEGKESIAFRTWEQQPWHPFLLEWEVEVFPTKSGSNHRNYNSNYEKDFITGNYCLKENEPNLFFQSGKGAIVKAANVYCGRSILTPYAGIKLKEQVEIYLRKQLPDNFQDYYELKNSDKEKAYLQKIEEWYKKKPNVLADLDQPEEIQAIKTWYEQKPCDDAHNLNLIFSNLSPDQKAKDPIYTAIRAEEALHQLNWDDMAKSINCLAQCLGGFNEALLMHKQTLQLPIADPLGFADYQPFTEAVRDAVQQSIRSAPEPLNDFNPIRSGAMKILRLRLVDTFGQVKDLGATLLRIWCKIKE
ncbi:hypothetical protein [Brunnivagina elsteri]|uniref:Uncharacterized protein n=1 Tax=Brunnivagina elsteri CCALA 953 TaxID=987040 RepID=A0A2A2TN51_9CYAN|nr:hypothetical protein [Calothrix elsteri]PAX59966.1 hypothetical protein CK510_04290 [Calothrix elsteri CCALA 953]